MTRTIFSFFDGHPYFNQLYSLRDFPHFCVCPLKGVVFVLCVLLTFGAQGPMDYQGIIPASDGRERSIIRPLSCFDFEKSSGPKVVYRMHCTFQLERVIIQSSPLKVPDVYFIRRCWRELRCCHHMSTQSLGLMEIRAAGKLHTNTPPRLMGLSDGYKAILDIQAAGQQNPWRGRIHKNPAFDSPRTPDTPNTNHAWAGDTSGRIPTF